MCGHHSVVTSSLTGEFRVGCLILWVRMQALSLLISSLALWLSVPRGGSARPVLLSSLHPQDEALSQRPGSASILSRLSQDWYLDSLTLQTLQSQRHSHPSATGSVKKGGIRLVCYRASSAAGTPRQATRVLWPGGTPLRAPWARPATAPMAWTAVALSQTWRLEPQASAGLAASQASPWCVDGRLPSVSAPNLFLEGSQSYWVRAPPIPFHFILVTFQTLYLQRQSDSEVQLNWL